VKRGSVAVVVVLALTASASAQIDRAAWIAWTRAHAHPVESLISVVPDDDFADLQFLKDVIGDRRLVQLGESGHGVAQFDSAKARIVKFFHEQMGFDVIAFESSMYECFVADRNAGALSAADFLNSSIFAVWSAQETLPLFDYIKASKSTERPLVLAGFDSQWSSPRGVAARATFFQRIVAAIDASYAEQVYFMDASFLIGVRAGNSQVFIKQHERELLDGFGRLETFLHEHREELNKAFPGDPSPLVAERTARSMVAFVRQMVAANDRPGDTTDQSATAIRDAAMADNLAFLMRELYPDKKILVWAHNFHIRHANAATSSSVRTMGGYTVDQFRKELYTIGLYMNRGTAAYNDRTVYTISPAPDESMEWVIFNAGGGATFVNFLNETKEPWNSWMFQSVMTREWGTGAVFMVPAEQYDGVLLIDQVTSPKYLPF
jgi:erythromycin esterase